MEKFTTITDYIDQVLAPALGEYADDFDLMELADDCVDYDAERQAFVQTVDEEEFWKIVEAHDQAE